MSKIAHSRQQALSSRLYTLLKAALKFIKNSLLLTIVYSIHMLNRYIGIVGVLFFYGSMIANFYVSLCLYLDEAVGKDFIIHYLFSIFTLTMVLTLILYIMTNLVGSDNTQEITDEMVMLNQNENNGMRLHLETAKQTKAWCSLCSVWKPTLTHHCRYVVFRIFFSLKMCFFP